MAKIESCNDKQQSVDDEKQRVEVEDFLVSSEVVEHHSPSFQELF